MPTPSGLKISQLPSGIRPSGYDLIAIVQNGNTVQVPVSSIRINTTADLPESGNLYFTNARARNALSAGDGLFYNSVDGIFALDGEFDTKLNTGYLSSITAVSVADEGRKKTIFIKTIGDPVGSNLTASWTDQGQDLTIDGTQGITSSFVNGIYSLANSDRGSSQNIFKTIEVSGNNSITASSNDDLITIVPGDNMIISADSDAKTLTIGTVGISNPVTGISAISGVNATRVGGFVTLNNSDKGSSQNIFKTIAISGLASVNATGNADTLNFVAGSNINFSTDPSTNKIIINAVSGAGLVGNVTSVNGLSGTVVLSTTNIPEGDKLYFTQDRARSSLSAGEGISITDGVITNTDLGSDSKGFDRIWLVSGVNQMSYGNFNVADTSPILNLIAGSGIALKASSNPSATNIAYMNYLTISATGESPAKGSSGNIQYNHNGAMAGASDLSYNPNTVQLSGKNVFIVPYTYGTGLRIQAPSGFSSSALAAFQDSSGNTLSKITGKGCFVGPVTPEIITTSSSLVLNDLHNGKAILSQLNVVDSGLYLYFGDKITVAGWNVKIIQDGGSQVYLEASGANFIKKPEDRYARTRTQGSVVEVLKTNDNTFFAYGDLGVIGSVGGTPPGDNGGGTPINPPGGGGDTPPGGGSCANAGNAVTISSLISLNGTISPALLADAQTVTPTQNGTVYPTILPQYLGNVVALSWGLNPSISLPVGAAQVTVSLPADRTCYDLISITDQFGYSTSYSPTKDSTYGVNVYAASTYGGYKNEVKYSEAPFSVSTRKIGGTTRTDNFRIAMGKRNFNLKYYFVEYDRDAKRGSSGKVNEAWISACYRAPLEGGGSWVNGDNIPLLQNTAGSDFGTLAEDGKSQILLDANVAGYATYRDSANGIGGNPAFETAALAGTLYGELNPSFNPWTISGGGVVAFIVVKCKTVTSGGPIFDLGSYSLIQGGSSSGFNGFIKYRKTGSSYDNYFWINSLGTAVTVDTSNTTAKLYIVPFELPAFQNSTIAFESFNGVVSECIIARWKTSTYASDPYKPWNTAIETNLFNPIITMLKSKYGIS